ncbi:MAG TPA: Zn-ribbon domain-containing OB-fold protein [Candidatus Binataceae bacterium]|nr:Zn-ribbon domain-containing OB-fold protein [Candidatus Binataceae bacterium]
MAAPVSKPIPVPTRETKPYWEGSKARELRIQRCAACGNAQFFPRIYCTRCMSDRVEWIKASGRGKVLSYTVVHRPVSPAFAGEIPYVVALVTLDEGPTMMTNIVGWEPEQLKIGMPVAVTFEDWTEEISIPKFRPL